jgi:SNF2 family DNA or RNA helicase
LQFQKTFEEYLLDGKIMDSSNFRKAMQFLAREDVEDDAMPESLADKMDETEEAQSFLDSLPTIDIKDYDLRALNHAIQQDIKSLGDIWSKVHNIGPEDDTKIQRLKSLLAGDLKGKKVIIFSYYKDTARYVERELIKDEAADFRHAAGDPYIRRMDGGNHPKERAVIVQAFAPKSNRKPEMAGTDKEIDVLISTDVLSEGQNLQDCGYLINYDLHWNPTRMVQRAGRIDRIGSLFDMLWIYNMFPDEGLEELLGIVRRLSQKIENIDKTGFLDASVLGEVVHPRNFGTLRRIMDEDGTVIEEEEQFVELASSESMMQHVKDFILAHGKEIVEDLPDGIHSGLARRRDSGLFFYFQAPGPDGDGKLHFWRYYNRNTGRIMDNRFLIDELIACQPDTPRVISDADVFAIHDMIMEDILKSQQEQQALEEAPKKIDAVQQQIVVILEALLANPRFKRKEVLGLIKFVIAPKSGVQIRLFRKLLAEYGEPDKSENLVVELSKLMSTYGAVEPQEPSKQRKKLEREDLRLICFDHICSG